MSEILFAFMLSLFAGLSTLIGAFLVFRSKADNKKFLSFSLGLSAGVMIYVPFMEMMPTALQYFKNNLSEFDAQLYAILGFFGGFLITGLIDFFVPEEENPHNLQSIEEIEKETKNFKLKRTGFLTAVVIAIHNFPEGIATFITAVMDPAFGVSIAVAVAIHNIPEGVSVAAPIYYSTKSKKEAFLYTFISGFAEPLGAFLVYLFLMPFVSEMVLGILFTIISGVMIYISLDELIPASRDYGEQHLSLLGLFIGMLIMAVSLLFL